LQAARISHLEAHRAVHRVHGVPLVWTFSNAAAFVHVYDAACCCHLQAARISHLEARRALLLATLPPELQQKVLKRQQEAATEEGELLLPAELVNGHSGRDLALCMRLPAAGQVTQ
jgi:hypothetical protein